jgi:cobalamin synthase
VSDLLCHALRLSDALCMVTWYPVAEIIVVSVCGAFASLLAAILPALVAPSHKQAAAIAGTLVSLPIAVWILVVLAFPLLLPVLISVLAALWAIRWVFRRYAAHRPTVVS